MKEWHKNSTVGAITIAFFALFSSWVNSEDDIMRSLDWHLEGATYGALMIFGESKIVYIWEICGTKTKQEILDIIDSSKPKMNVNDGLIIFTYEKYLKQISYGNTRDRFTSRIGYRSIDISDDRIFTDFGSKSVEEISSIFEKHYSASKRLITP